jgi:NADH:ubiquinone oxidoreductase subunit 6 (subunit J)
VKNKIIGAISLLIAFVIMFTSPVIYDNYFSYFQLEKTGQAGLVVSLSLAFAIYIFGGIAFEFLTKKQDNHES